MLSLYQTRHISFSKPPQQLYKFTKRHFFGSGTPLKYETSDIMPFSQELFFRVVLDVDNYEKFIPWITKSYVLPETIQESFENGVKKGRFDAITKIGFGQVSFEYLSHVTYKTPTTVTSQVQRDHPVFSGMTSVWQIDKQKDGNNKNCVIHYRINMQFSNTLYQQVTSQFFDYLVENINSKFKERCQFVSKEQEKEKQQSEKAILNDKVKSTLIPGIDSKLTDNISFHHQNQSGASATHLDEVDDQWIWSVKEGSQDHDSWDRRDRRAKQGHIEKLLLKQTWKDMIVDSIAGLQKNNYLQEYPLNQIQRALESSDNLLREFKVLYDAFGQESELQAIYIRHLNHLLETTFHEEN